MEREPHKKLYTDKKTFFFVGGGGLMSEPVLSSRNESELEPYSEIF